CDVRRVRRSPTSTLFPYTTLFRSQCRSSLRSRWQTIAGLDQAEPVSDPEDEAVVARVELRQALRAMNQDKRLVLVLHFYLDLPRSEEHTSELQSPYDLVCRLLLEN